MATIQDIADRLGVSKGTVSKAINNAPDISETLRNTRRKEKWEREEQCF